MTGNKFLITTALILLMLASLVNGTAVVKANPIPWSASPNQEKPALTIQSPTNNSRYPSEVPLDFNVTAPNSWSAYYWPEYYVGEINSITVYPNPVGDKVNISLHTVESMTLNFEIINMTGEILQRMQTEAGRGSNHYILSTGSLHSGIYSLRISSDKGYVLNKKLVKLN